MIAAESPTHKVLTSHLCSAVLSALCRAPEQAGLHFLPTNDGRLPDRCFVSVEFIHWLIRHVGDINDKHDAITFAQQLLVNEKICHISGMFVVLITLYIYYVICYLHLLCTY